MFYVLSLNEKGYFSINYALVVQAVITAAAAPICLSILNKIRLFLFPNNILNEGQR
jgi:hypothetical protein